MKLNDMFNSSSNGHIFLKIKMIMIGFRHILTAQRSAGLGYLRLVLQADTEKRQVSFENL